jgi:hypothetical protein
MNDQESPETGFARRLRAELKSVVAERGAEQATRAEASDLPARIAWRRRGPRIGLAGATVAGVAAVALIISAGGGGDTPAAFAVETQPEGKISVEVSSLEDPAGLEAALEDAGVSASVSYLESGMRCKEPRFQAASAEGARALVAGPGSLISPSMGGEGPITFTIDRNEVEPGQTLVVAAWPRPGALLGGAEMRVADGTVAPCEPVPVPAEGNGGGDK